MFYVITIVLLFAAYALMCVFFKVDKKREAITNVALTLIVFFCYIFGVIRMYLSVGADDWNFTNTLPTANVSPFMFCLTLVALVLPEKIKTVVYTLVSMLSFGMLVAGTLSLFSYVLRDYGFHFTIALDGVAHFALSFFGIYLVKSGQVKIDFKNCIAPAVLIFSVAVTMAIINAVFKTSFFGLGFYGNHNIYNMRITESAAVNTVLYFTGLTAALVLGCLYIKLMTRKRQRD